MVDFNASEPVVILGFGQMGQVNQSLHCENCCLYGLCSKLCSKFSPFDSDMEVLANFLSNPLASGGDSDAVGWPYIAFDLDPRVVKVSIYATLCACMPIVYKYVQRIFLPFCRDFFFISFLVEGCYA